MPPALRPLAEGVYPHPLKPARVDACPHGRYRPPRWEVWTPLPPLESTVGARGCRTRRVYAKPAPAMEGPYPLASDVLRSYHGGFCEWFSARDSQEAAIPHLPNNCASARKAKRG
jgi:hypothetical protein